MRVDSGPEADDALRGVGEGRTGYPIVDAGMRQLLGEAYVHNRVRMIVGRFLVKDLHLDWVRGARHFLRHLVDGDLASNNHGWQWVAGTGTDASPYYRVFNPTSQGKQFDPDGDYVRRWVPELRDVPRPVRPRAVAPPGGRPAGYPSRSSSTPPSGRSPSPATTTASVRRPSGLRLGRASPPTGPETVAVRRSPTSAVEQGGRGGA